MKVLNLINALKKLPANSEIELYHHIYCGGGDEDRFDEPTLFADADEKGVFYLSVHYLKEGLEYAIGNEVSIK